MSAELPLSTRTRWTVLLATTGDAGSPPGPSQRMLWLCRAEAVWTPLVLPSPLMTLCCADGPSWLSWIPLLLQIPPRSHGFPLRVVGAELLPAEVAAAAAEPEPDSEPDLQVL